MTALERLTLMHTRTVGPYFDPATGFESDEDICVECGALWPCDVAVVCTQAHRLAGHARVVSSSGEGVNAG